MKVHFIFKSDKNYYGKWAFYLIEKYGGTSLYRVLRHHPIKGPNGRKRDVPPKGPNVAFCYY